MPQAIDTETANRLRDEFLRVREALQGMEVASIEDPLGSGDEIEVVMNYFRASGAGDVTMKKTNEKGDKRFTRFRTWGADGMDYVEKSSYLVKANGVKEFAKKRAEPGDSIHVAHEADSDDEAWISKLG
ncbi:MAG: hypothetical protein K8T10_05555 [Candidatus Eremiobacteraeota bacterium]|nr:hypothetical protein [Candidatus Eremiobacteraeota bacterium]